MRKKVRPPIGSLFRPLRLGSPTQGSPSGDDRTIPRSILIQILTSHSVQYNDGLINDLQDLSVRSQFDSKNVGRIFSKNGLLIPIPDTLGKITSEIKQRKSSSPVKPACGPSVGAIRITKNQSAPTVDVLSLLRTGLTNQRPNVIRFPEANFELPFDFSRGERLRTKYNDLLTPYDKEILKYLTQAKDAKFMDVASRVRLHASQDELVTALKHSLLLARAEDLPPEVLIPGSEKFDKVCWFFKYLYPPVLKILKEYNKSKIIPDATLAKWLCEIASASGCDLSRLKVGPLISGKTSITIKEFSRLANRLLSDIVRPHGIFRDNDGAIGIEIPSLTRKMRTKAGIEVPVYTTYTLCGDLYSATATEDHIFLESESEVWQEALRENCKIWWRNYQEKNNWPSLIEHPQLIPYWLGMLMYGEISLEEGETLDHNILLEEELWHTNSLAYMALTVPDDIHFWQMGYTTVCIKTILREKSEPLDNSISLWTDLQKKPANSQEQDEFADSIVEIEGKLGVLQTSPYPVSNLIYLLNGIIIPKSHLSPRITSSNEIENNYLCRILSSALFNQETLDPKIWIPYIVERIQDRAAIERFGEEIKQAAYKAHKSQFLTQEERDEKNPNWRERFLNIT